MRKYLLWLLGACVLLPFMVSTQSFWIDECGSARFACAPSWSIFFELLKSDLSSDSQMPLFMFLSRIWHLLVGCSEYALRSINIIFGIVSVLSAYFVSKKLQVRPWLMVGLLVLHPFLCAYMDEFRPYVMQIAGGWLMLLAICELRATDKPGLVTAGLFSIAALLLVGSSLLGVIPLFIFGMLWLLQLLRKTKRCSVGFWLCFGFVCLLIAALGVFYLTKLMHGGGGSKSWTPGLGNVIFSLYELLGFMGLGPGRNDLRAAASGGSILGVMRTFLPALSLMGLAYALVFIEFFRLSIERRKTMAASLLLIGVGFAAMLGLAIVFAWPFWGRHLAPFFPVLIVVLALALESMIERTQRYWKGGLIFFALLLVASSLNVRLSKRFDKDDYRAAYTLARPLIESGAIVWWAANTESAFYYGVTESPLDQLPSNMIRIINASDELLEKEAAPAIIVLSKPELYDQAGSIRSYTIEAGSQIEATPESFVIWRPDEKMQ